MNQLPLAYAFGAGLLTALNPCGLALLPSFIAFYLGVQEPGYRQMPAGRRLLQALAVGGLVTAGFLTIVVIGGLLVSAGLRFIVAWVPYLTIVIGLALMLTGGLLLLGRGMELALPQPRPALRRRGLLPMYLYGVSYAIGSLSCTLPVFMVVVGSAVALGGAGAALSMFLAYGVGTGVVLMALTVGAALFQGAVARWLRSFAPYIRRVSAVLLVLAGGYIILYQLQSLQVVAWGTGYATGQGQNQSRLTYISVPNTAPDTLAPTPTLTTLTAGTASETAPAYLQVPISPTTGPDSTYASGPAASPSARTEDAAGEPGQGREAGAGTAGVTFYVPALITAPTFSDGCCVWASDQWVTARIQAVDGVKQVSVDKEKATVQVVYDPSVIQPEQIANELASAGYPAERQQP